MVCYSTSGKRVLEPLAKGRERGKFQVGYIVLLEEEHVVRNLWPMTKVTEVFPSEDVLVRSLHLLVVNNTAPGKTSSVKRPIAKMVLICEAGDQKMQQEGITNIYCSHR